MTENENATILVVDDDEIKRYTATRALTKAGFAVREASSGAEALEAVRSNPDLIILDIQLPDVDGFEVCRRIKADPAHSSTIILHRSAVATDSADKAQGLEGGADGYIVEPVGADELIATVRSMLRIRSAEREARALSHQWQTTFDAIGDGVIVVDERGTIARANAAASDVLGPGALELRAEDALGAGDDGAALFARARDTRERQTLEFERGGRWFRAAADPVLDETGKASGAVCIVRDVTAARALERERAEALDRERDARSAAESANRYKDEFLATISHELRTPLNAMLGWLALLRGGQLGAAEIKRAYETLDRSARSQAQLISDILDVSRIITGKIRLDVSSIDVAAVVASAIESVRPAADAKEILLQVSIDPEAGRVSGDAERLQQIIWNLLSNAVKFTPKGGQIRISLEREGSNITIRVADSGAGIDAEFLPHVFERFRQADSSTTRQHGGLGLGLAIVRHLVELHGGTVQAESGGAGKGAAFTVSLPVSPVVERSYGDVRRQEPSATLGDLTPLDGVRVLVVDDDDDTRQMLATVLERCRASVQTADSAAEALKLLHIWRPDVVVSDIGMPNEDGYSLMRSIRALPPEQGGRVPSVALTAYARTEDRLRALTSGFQTYISKPADPAEVTAVVASLAGRIGGV